MTRSVDDQAWTPTRLPDGAGSAAVDRRLLQAVDREHDFAVHRGDETVVVDGEAHLEEAVHAGEVRRGDVRDRVPQLAVGAPLAHEIAAAFVDRVDVERIAGHPAFVVEVGAEQHAETRTGSEVDVHLDREVATTR